MLKILLISSAIIYKKIGFIKWFYQIYLKKKEFLVKIALRFWPNIDKIFSFADKFV